MALHPMLGQRLVLEQVLVPVLVLGQALVQGLVQAPGDGERHQAQGGVLVAVVVLSLPRGA